MSNQLHLQLHEVETLEALAENYAHNYFNMHETNNYKALKQGFKAGYMIAKTKLYTPYEVQKLMTLAYEQGFKKADVVEAGLEGKETEEEVRWIFMKNKSKNKK